MLLTWGSCPGHCTTSNCVRSDVSWDFFHQHCSITAGPWSNVNQKQGETCTHANGSSSSRREKQTSGFLLGCVLRVFVFAVVTPWLLLMLPLWPCSSCAVACVDCEMLRGSALPPHSVQRCLFSSCASFCPSAEQQLLAPFARPVPLCRG